MTSLGFIEHLQRKYLLWLGGRITPQLQSQVYPVIRTIPKMTEDERNRLLERAISLKDNIQGMTDAEMCLGAGILHFFIAHPHLIPTQGEPNIP